MKRPFAPAARGSAPRLALWALLLSLPLARGLEVGDAYVQLDFFQESFPSGKEAGEEAVEFNAEEILHVDWGQKRDVWRLEDFQDFVRGDVQGALGNLAILKTNLEILVKRSGRKMEPNMASSATVYPRKPVELGEPNVLRGRVLSPSAKHHLAEEQAGGLQGRAGDRLPPQPGLDFPQILLPALHPGGGRPLRLPGGPLGPPGEPDETLG